MRSCDIIDAVCDWLATLVDRIYDAFALPGVAVVAYITACIIRLSILMLGTAQPSCTGVYDVPVDCECKDEQKLLGDW